MKPALAFQHWRTATAAEIDQAAVLARVHAESGWANRFAFMILLSAGSDSRNKRLNPEAEMC